MKNGIESWEQLQQVCTGCGLCAAMFGAEMIENERGFLRPSSLGSDTFELVRTWCPSINIPSIYDDNSWGHMVSAYLGWANDRSIREKASSGGILTSVACYALESGIVECVLQIGPDDQNPLFAKPRFSTTSDDVISCSGSRYVSCSTLSGLTDVLRRYSKIAVIARPCEIRALKLLMSTDSQIAASVVLTLSFFCMGLPSRKAARKLLCELGVDDFSLASFSYRGNGWPGFATATSSSGEKRALSYDESWGQILGRDVEDYCKFCFDGVGEYADISAGDAWFAKEDGSPVFSEHEGRNVVFARSDLGESVLCGMAREGRITLEEFSDWEYLQNIQYSQYSRKALAGDRNRVLKASGKRFFSVNRSRVGKYAKEINVATRIKSSLGLFRRLIQKKIQVP